MATVNEALQDAATSHAVDLEQYKTGVVLRMIALLNRVDGDLAAQLAIALDRLPASQFTIERLESLLYSVRDLNRQAYESIRLALPAELQALTAYEASYQLELFRSVIPPQVVAQVGVAAVNAEQVYAAAMARPFQGTLLREALTSLEEGRARQIRDAVRIGYVENQPLVDIVRRVRGTRARGYADGLLEAPRHHIESLVRTAVSHTAGFTRDRFYEANSDLIVAVAWTSTLDTRTSETCRLRDGKRYSNDTHKPIGHAFPWLSGPGRAHWGCRSVSVPVTKSWRDLGLDVDEMDAGTRASMDGQVPAEQNYGDWLKKQSAARQDQVLGPVRGKLMRDGGLTIDRFATDKGRWLDLDELRERDAAAFARAGL